MASQSDLWAGIGGVLRRRGDTIAAVEAWQKAFALDPRSAELSREVATTLNLLRRYDEALSYFDKSIALAPDQELSYAQKARLLIQKSGDVTAARRVLEAAVGLPPSDEAWIDVEMFRRDYAAALARARLLPAEAAPDQGGIHSKALTMARLHALAGERDAALSAYDAAKTFLIGELERRPNDWRVHGALGMAYAGLDRKAEAIAEGRRAMDLNPLSRDAFFGAIPLYDLARIYAAVGEGDRALELIDQLLSIPSRMSVAALKTDPSWDTLRSSPAYGNLISRYESPSR